MSRHYDKQLKIEASYREELKRAHKEAFAKGETQQELGAKTRGLLQKAADEGAVLWVRSFLDGYDKALWDLTRDQTVFVYEYVDENCQAHLYAPGHEACEGIRRTCDWPGGYEALSRDNPPGLIVWKHNRNVFFVDKQNEERLCANWK